MPLSCAEFTVRALCKAVYTGSIPVVASIRHARPNVPSDIEQMPALENFVPHNGTLLSNDHTVLISHTAEGIISTETGLYPDQNGSGVSNTYPYLDPQQGGTHNTSASSTSVPGTNASSLFQGWVGPGIRHLGETSSIWTDRAGIRPTMMTLLGLKDDYAWDGAASAQILDRWGGLPWTISS